LSSLFKGILRGKGYRVGQDVLEEFPGCSNHPLRQRRCGIAQEV